LLDRLGGADDRDDARREAEKEPDEEAPVPGANPAIDQQPAAGPQDDGDDERDPDAPERPEGLHRVFRRAPLLAHYFFFSAAFACPEPGRGGASFPAPHAGSIANPGSLGGGA